MAGPAKSGKPGPEADTTLSGKPVLNRACRTVSDVSVSVRQFEFQYEQEWIPHRPRVVQRTLRTDHPHAVGEQERAAALASFPQGAGSRCAHLWVGGLKTQASDAL